MKLTLALLLAACAIPSAAFAQPAGQQQSDQAEARKAALDKALAAINTSKPAEAVSILDPLLIEYEREYASEKGTIYCADNGVDTLLYLGGFAVAIDQGKSKSQGAIVIDMGWCNALWARGYALIDLQQVDGAVPYLQRAVAMAPSHAHFLSELAYAYQAQRKWQQSYETFERAAGSAERYEGDLRKKNLRRAWFGMAYDLVELGRLKEAEGLLLKCLELVPDDERVKKELDYVREQLRKGS